jgi:hypothetical protein
LNYRKKFLYLILNIVPPPSGYGRWLREILSDFAQKVGNGGTEPTDEIEQEWGPVEIMGIDLDMRGSEELWGAEDFEWRAEDGMGENARKVMEEFERKMSKLINEKYFFNLKMFSRAETY